MPSAQYSWRFEEDKTRDLGIYEIIKSTCEFPYTVLIHNYSKAGPKQLFSDIFYAPSWDESRGADGKVSDDICFLIGLWEELGLMELMGEPFHPRHINCDDGRYPTVYRKGMIDVMAQLYGTGIVDTTLSK